AAGDKLTAVLLQTLEAAGADHHELISIYYGNGLSAAEVEATVAQVRQRFPAQQVDVIAGGQPHYYFIVGIE
ncbi:MAG: DAK2 domain-containing protein, partial [Thermoflexales bacterium]